MNTKAKVPVLSSDGRLMGHVGSNTTSVGAAKIAKAPCEMSWRFGCKAWVAKRQ